jgi:DNA-binding CsgD family transcriptional regulator
MVATGRGIDPGRALRISRPSGKRPLVVWAAPVIPTLLSQFGFPGAHILLIITDPETTPRCTIGAAFVELYGLTKAEAAVLEDLANGTTPEEIHVHLGMSLPTVRKHIQSLFAKTGVRRQIDLVRLVFSTQLMK